MESATVQAKKARVVGFNHVALEVGDIEEALAFYRRLFDFKLRGKSATSAFIDLGDQFIALQKGRTQPADEGRHFGLVVDDKDAVRKALADTGIQPLPGPFLDFLDPWGNRIEIVGYDNVQFTKALLAKPAPSVTKIGLMIGFSETSSFTAAFRKATGLTPTAYHRGLA